MDLHPLTEDHVKSDEPLRVDVFDAQGRLLLKAGATPSATQLARLLEHGLYADPVALEAAIPGSVSAGTAKPHPPAGGMRVVERIARAKRQLAAWQSEALAGQTDLAPLHALAEALAHDAALDPDACMGQISFDRPPGYAARHAVDSALIGALLARQLGESEDACTLLIRAALTMNLGMVQLQDRLYSHAGALGSDDQAAVRAHPQRSAELLAGMGVQDARWLSLVLQHHEAADGSGYPAGLNAGQIDPLAQCIAMADQICALLSERAHREAVNPMRAMEKLAQAAPRSVRPDVVQALLGLMTPCPPGAVVRLASGDTAVLARRTRHAEAPIAMVFLNRMHRRFDPPVRRPTSGDAQRIVEALPQGAIDPRPAASAIWDEVFEQAGIGAASPPGP